MEADGIQELVRIHLTLSADEARALYAQLYRVSADELLRPWPRDSPVQELMILLSKHGADS
jgi:hypothetical protein